MKPRLSQGPVVLAPIPRNSLREMAVTMLRAAISRGELKPGDPVTELGIGKKMAISQITAREALRELEFLGLVQRLSAKKKCITKLNRKQIEDVYVVRSPLETLVIEALCKLEQRDLTRVDEQVSRMEKAAAGYDLENFLDADLSFHRALWESCGNQALAEVLNMIVPRIFAFDNLQRPSPGAAQLAETAQLHRRLLDLVKQGDIAAATAMSDALMRQAYKEDVEFA